MGRPRIDPGRWRPPPRPALTGTFARNDRLAAIERWPVPGTGPEDVAFDADGHLYTGVADGRILRLPPGGGAPDEVARTDGRPLGVEVDGDGTLVVCDAYRGLLRVDPGTGTVAVLADHVDGHRLTLTDNASVAPDGRIYFSEASRRYPLDRHRTDVLEHRGNGLLCVHDPSSGETRALVEGLFFANGVAVAPDGASVLVAESSRFRIQRLWLRGPRAGELERFVDNLPGFPDNITATTDGRFWVALPVRRNPAYDRLLPRPRLRALVAALPGALTPPADESAMVVCLDGDGRVVDQLQGPRGLYDYVTVAGEHDGWLYLGSLHRDAVARVRAG